MKRTVRIHFQGLVSLQFCHRDEDDKFYQSVTTTEVAMTEDLGRWLILPLNQLLFQGWKVGFWGEEMIVDVRGLVSVVFGNLKLTLLRRV